MECIKRVVNFLQRFWPAVFAIVIATIIYAPSFYSGYFADDYHFLNRYLGSEPVTHAFTRNIDGNLGGGSWRPLTGLSLHLSMQLFQSAFADHFISFALYIGVAIIWYALLGDLFPRTSYKLRFIGMMALLLLPIHAEPVIWVGARADLLAAFFGLLSVYLVRKKMLFFALAAFALSLLSKEFWIAIPAVWALSFRGEISRKRLIIFWGATATIILSWIGVRYAITQYSVGGYSITEAQNVFGYRHLINEWIAFTFGLFTFGRAQARIIGFFQQNWMVGALVLAGIYSAAAYVSRQTKSLLIAYGGVVATLAPVLLLSTSFIRLEGTVGEQRYWFAPSLFVVLLGVGLWDEYLAPRFSKGAKIAGMAILIAVILGSRHNIRIFTEAAAYRDTLVSGWRTLSQEHPSTELVALGLPDTWYGVHLGASPFFEEMVRFNGLSAPKSVAPVYQWCGQHCEQAPASAFREATGVTLQTTDPRIFSMRAPGLRFSFSEDELSREWVGVWTGAHWTVLPPIGVEK